MIFNGKVIKIVALISMLRICDVQAMDMMNFKYDSALDIKRPLSDWPIRDYGTESERANYLNSWDESRGLEENKSILVKNFMEECCDFSFQLIDMGLKGIYLGKFGSFEDIVFANVETQIKDNLQLKKAVLYNPADRGRGLRVQYKTSILPGIVPLSMEDWMPLEIQRYIGRIADDSMGCEILRKLIAKYKSNRNRLSKIKFIPVKNSEISMSYTPGEYVWKYIKDSEGIDYKDCSRQCRGNNFIVFSLDWFNTDQLGLMLGLKEETSSTYVWSDSDISTLIYSGSETLYDSDGKTVSSVETDRDNVMEEEIMDLYDISNEFYIRRGVLPKELCLLHQIIYATNDRIGETSKGTSIIEGRVQQPYFSGKTDALGEFMVETAAINVSIFEDDRVYRTMYGLTDRGLDMINESAYLAHKCDYIRIAYIGAKTELSINGKEMNQDETFCFLKEYFRYNGDQDLYSYYLSPYSSIEYPRFGSGNYKCSDLIPYD